PTLYRSVDHGGHWSAVRGLHARRALHLFLNPANPRLVYALSDRGLYHSRDAGATWTRLTARRPPAVGRIRTLTFAVHAPASVSVVPWQGPPLRLVEPQAPVPPRFDLALALTPQRYDRVVLAVHAAPRARARLTVVGGATRTSARLLTDAAGFGYASVQKDRVLCLLRSANCLLAKCLTRSTPLATIVSIGTTLRAQRHRGDAIVRQYREAGSHGPAFASHTHPGGRGRRRGRGVAPGRAHQLWLCRGDGRRAVGGPGQPRAPARPHPA